MIRHSQKALGLVRTASDAEGGVSCPNFVKVAEAFGILSDHVFGNTPSERIDGMLKAFQAYQRPTLIEVHCSPEQLYLPKLMGSPGYSPALDELSPMRVPA